MFTTGEKFVVNLEKMKCSYCKWMLTKIPCCHALCTMKFLNVDEVNFIPNWFHKATYADVYSPIVYLVNGQHVWETNEIPNVLPPPTKKMSGRLKKEDFNYGN